MMPRVNIFNLKNKTKQKKIAEIFCTLKNHFIFIENLNCLFNFWLGHFSDEKCWQHNTQTKHHYFWKYFLLYNATKRNCNHCRNSNENTGYGTCNNAIECCMIFSTRIAMTLTLWWLRTWVPRVASSRFTIIVLPKFLNVFSFVLDFFLVVCCCCLCRCCCCCFWSEIWFADRLGEEFEWNAEAILSSGIWNGIFYMVIPIHFTHITNLLGPPVYLPE